MGLPLSNRQIYKLEDNSQTIDLKANNICLHNENKYRISVILVYIIENVYRKKKLITKREEGRGDWGKICATEFKNKTVNIRGIELHSILSHGKISEFNDDQCKWEK